MDTGKESIGVIVRPETEENGLVGMGRVLTIQIEIVDDIKAAWIWHNHMNNNPTYGVHVTAIQEGPIPKEAEQDEDD